MSKEKVEVEEKDSTFKFFLIIVIIMAVLSIGCCVGVLIGYNMNKDNETIKEENDALEPERVVTDENLKNDLVKYVTYLEKYAQLNIDDNYPYQTGDIYYKDYKSSDISKDKKLRIVLMGLNSEFLDKSPMTTNYQLPDGVNSEFVNQIEVSDVENTYKKMFGGTISHRSFDSADDKFRKIFYDDINKKYYAMVYGGITTTYYVETFVSKVTQEKNNMYVYVNVGVSSLEECYADYKREKTVECNHGGNLITEDNKDKFSEYKFVFTNKDGNYLFSEVKKVK